MLAQVTAKSTTLTAKSSTLGELITQTERRLRAAKLSYGHGTLNARDEAAWLVSHAAKLSPDLLIESLHKVVCIRVSARIDSLIDKRIKSRKPLAYLLGEAWLSGYKFLVDQRVIVPRSYIAEPLLEAFSPWISRPGTIKRILDLCTGSGCLAILAALAFPRAQVDAVDISKRSLAVAKKNVQAYGLAQRVTLIPSDLFRSLPPTKYDLIISNPPYVDARAMKRLPEEYRREPQIALDGGNDGLEFVDRILKESRSYLTSKGSIVIEIGRNRRAFERRYPRLNVMWLDSTDHQDAVIWIDANTLLAS
ncbi:MAG: 50S ribosomal protein L3 N(5)-glutamine methyltransferase [Burkholderiales bacterium]